MIRQDRPEALAWAFGGVLCLLALFCTGFGHGTYLPLAIFGAPLSLVPVDGIALAGPPVVWGAIGTVIYATQSPLLRLVALLAHVVSVGVVLSAGSQFESANEQWTYLLLAQWPIRALAIGSGLFYLGGLLLLGYFAVFQPVTRGSED